VRECHRTVKPDGVALATVPSLGRLGSREADYWRFTPNSVRYLFEQAFHPSALTVEPYGNIVAGLAFWAGMGPDDLTRDEPDERDPTHPCTVCVRAVKRPS